MYWDGWMVCNQHYCFDVLMFCIAGIPLGIAGIALLIKLLKKRLTSFKGFTEA